ncbi:MAG: ribonuclease domain-containing protein [Formosimonas sp.]
MEYLTMTLKRILTSALTLAALAGCWQNNSNTRTSTAETTAQANTGDTIAYRQLPPEAQEVIERIESGGSFPYKQDGQTFQNREKRLPEQPRGYYKEYTVVTPNASNRGARRIVAGQPREYYYTPDHYRNFYKVQK